MSGGKRKRAGRKVTRGAVKMARLGASLGAVIPEAGSRMVRPAKSAFRRLPLRTRLCVIVPMIAMSLASLVLVTLLVTYTITIPDPLSLLT